MKKTLIAACAAMAFGAAVAEEPKPPKRIFGETGAGHRGVSLTECRHA